MTERKMIYLDDALEAIRKLPNGGIHWFVSAEAVFNALLKLPPAQTKIIRCKDCIHGGEKPIADGRYWCEIHDTFMYYCSDAERLNDKGGQNKET